MHVQRAWRAKTNRVTGIASLAIYGLLIVTAFGLYYLGSEAVRPWISYIHIAFGLAVPAVITAHVMVGRASVAANAPEGQGARRRCTHAGAGRSAGRWRP